MAPRRLVSGGGTCFSGEGNEGGFRGKRNERRVLQGKKKKEVTVGKKTVVGENKRKQEEKDNGGGRFKQNGMAWRKIFDRNRRGKNLSGEKFSW